MAPSTNWKSRPKIGAADGRRLTECNNDMMDRIVYPTALSQDIRDARRLHSLASGKPACHQGPGIRSPAVPVAIHSIIESCIQIESIAE